MEAVGYLRYGPDSPSVPRKGYWSILACDPDWFKLYGLPTMQKLPGKWVWAVDKDRIVNGAHGLPEPRLAYYRPTLLAPAWQPHISITRNEKPRDHERLWDLAVQIGDLQDIIRAVPFIVEFHERKIAMLCEQRDPKAKGFIKEHEQAIAKAKARKVAATRKLPSSEQLWLEKAGRMDTFRPGKEVVFSFDPTDIRTNGNHWWFLIQCPLLNDFRQAYGLSREPFVPLHLTFAVLEGSG